MIAKPVIDVMLAVADSRGEDDYSPALEAAGYLLHIREPHWYEHRMLRRRNREPGSETNLHVFSFGCPEIDRTILFRDWLRSDPADAKAAVIEEIIALSRRSTG